MDNQLLDTINLDAYFQRIGYSGALRSPTLETLQAIHLHHTKTIAFENLNSLLKQPVLLDLASLQRKLVQDRRGGYCFEQNALLRSVLLQLGFRVTNLAARVLWNLPEGIVTPRSHMLLLVEIEGAEYIADVGFGGITLTTPLSLIPEIKQNTSHEPFRLMKSDHQSYVMQVFVGQEWKSLYRFDLQAQQLPDYEVSNWYVSTHPNSIFVNTLMAARPDSDRRYALRNNQLTTYYLDGKTEHQVIMTTEELCRVLEDVFLLKLPSIENLNHDLQRLIQE